MKKRRDKRKISLIISLVLHILIILLFTYQAFKHKSQIKFSPKSQREKKQSRASAQSALLPKMSDGGTKVVFIDRSIEPVDKKLEEDDTVKKHPKRIVKKVL